MTTQTTSGQETRGTGTDTLDVAAADRPDPNRSRKEIYARASAGTQAEVDIDRSTHEGIDAMSAAMDAQAAGEDPVEQTFREYGEQVRAQQEQEEAERAGDAAAAAPGDEIDGGDAAAAPADDEPVTLKVFGQDIVLPKSKVDEMGGEKAAQLYLAADFRNRQSTQLANLAKEAQDAANAEKQRYEQLQRGITAGGTTVPPTPVDGTQTPTQGKATEDELRAAVKKTVGVMFSGDEQGAEEALTEALAKVRGTTMPTAEEIAEVVLAKVESRRRSEDATRKAEEAQRAADEERKAVNALMATKFGAITSDPELLTATQALFQRERNDPRNAGRSLVSIADSCGMRMAEIAGIHVGEAEEAPQATEVQAEIRTRQHLKRRIPSPSSSSDRAPAGDSEPSYPTKPSDIINMIRAARGQPTM
jgi:hypothetical protein